MPTTPACTGPECMPMRTRILFLRGGGTGAGGRGELWVLPKLRSLNKLWLFPKEPVECSGEDGLDLCKLLKLFTVWQGLVGYTSLQFSALKLSTFCGMSWVG